MRFAQLLACCAVLVLCCHEGMALKCRTGEHQANDQFQRVMHRCRDRILQGNRKTGDINSSTDDDDDDDNYDDDDSSESSEKGFDKKFGTGRTGTTGTSMMKNSGSNNSGDQKSNSRRYEQNSSTRPYPYNRIMSNSSNSGADDTKDRLSRNNTTLRNGGSPNGMMNSGQNDMQTNQHDQACVIQCFFDELNLIDQNGFPEKSAVTRVMMQSIQDQELQDFVEEAVMDCFYLIDSDKNKEQCRFSQNLLTCLAGKGRERCEDWD